MAATTKVVVIFVVRDCTETVVYTVTQKSLVSECDGRLITLIDIYFVLYTY